MKKLFYDMCYKINTDDRWFAFWLIVWGVIGLIIGGLVGLIC